MPHYAIIRDGIVVNVIEYASHPTTPPPGFAEGHTAVQADRVSPGWLYQSNVFIDPTPPHIPTPDEINQQIQAQIHALELTQPQAVRQFILTGNTAQVQAIEDAIAALKEQLT